MSHSPTPRQTFRAVSVLAGYYLVSPVWKQVCICWERIWDVESVVLNSRPFFRISVSCAGALLDTLAFVRCKLLIHVITCTLLLQKKKTICIKAVLVLLTWWRDGERLWLNVAPVSWDWLHLAQISLLLLSASKYQQLLWGPVWLLWLWPCE